MFNVKKWKWKVETEMSVLIVNGFTLHLLIIELYISSIVSGASHWSAPELLEQCGINSGLPTFGISDGDT